MGPPMSATVLSFSSPNTAAIARIDAVRRVANELYDERDEDGHRRDLETHEALFISAVNAITRGYASERSKALQVWGDGKAYEALCNLTYRQEASDLETALASYKAEAARRFNDELEGVAFQMSEAAE
jgi:hypothetical protein